MRSLLLLAAALIAGPAAALSPAARAELEKAAPAWRDYKAEAGRAAKPSYASAGDWDTFWDAAQKAEDAILANGARLRGGLLAKGELGEKELAERRRRRQSLDRAADLYLLGLYAIAIPDTFSGRERMAARWRLQSSGADYRELVAESWIAAGFTDEDWRKGGGMALPFAAVPRALAPSGL